MNKSAPLFGLAVLNGVFVWSAIEPAGCFIWWLEAVPVLMGVSATVCLYACFCRTPMALSVVFVGSVMMLVGAHYSFADVPLGHWLADMLGWSRNPYDRFGHVVQGVIPKYWPASF